MYVEEPNVYHNRAEQVVGLQWKLNSRAGVVSRHQHGSVPSDVFLPLSCPSLHNDCVYLIHARADLSRATVPFLPTLFYI